MCSRWPEDTANTQQRTNRVSRLAGWQPGRQAGSHCMPTTTSEYCCRYHRIAPVPPATPHRENESFYWVNFYTNCGCTFRRRRDILQMILLFQECSRCRRVYLLSPAHNGGASAHSVSIIIIIKAHREWGSKGVHIHVLRGGWDIIRQAGDSM